MFVDATSGEVVTQQAVALEAVQASGFAAVELQEPVTFHQLVGAVVVAESPGVGRVVVQQVAAKRHIWLVVTQIPEDGGQNRRLLGNHVVAAGGFDRPVGSVEYDRYLVDAQIGEVLIAGELVGVVGYEHKQCVVVPRLAAGALEEPAQSHVGVSHAFVYGLVVFVLENAGIFIGNTERVVARGGEHGCHKRLAHSVYSLLGEL